MEDCLTCIMIAVQDKAESSLCHSFSMSYNIRNVEKMAKEIAVVLRNIKECGYMFSRDYESMDGGLRVDIFKTKCALILVNDRRCRFSVCDLAKNTFHIFLPEILSGAAQEGKLL